MQAGGQFLARANLPLCKTSKSVALKTTYEVTELFFEERVWVFWSELPHIYIIALYSLSNTHLKALGDLDLGDSRPSQSHSLLRPSWAHWVYLGGAFCFTFISVSLARGQGPLIWAQDGMWEESKLEGVQLMELLIASKCHEFQPPHTWSRNQIPLAKIP